MVTKKKLGELVKKAKSRERKTKQHLKKMILMEEREHETESEKKSDKNMWKLEKKKDKMKAFYFSICKFLQAKLRLNFVHISHLFLPSSFISTSVFFFPSVLYNTNRFQIYPFITTLPSISFLDIILPPKQNGGRIWNEH